MKRFYLLILIFLLSKCDRVKQTPIKQANVSIRWIYNPIDQINVRLLRIASQYFDSLNKNKKDSLKACRLFVEQKNTNTSFRISPVTHFSSVKDDLPCGYIEFKDKAILIYTGMERLFKKNSELPPELGDMLEGKLINDLLPNFKTINPKVSYDVHSFPTWEISLDSDSLKIVTMNAERVWRVKTRIYSLPDSLK